MQGFWFRLEIGIIFFSFVSVFSYNSCLSLSLSHFIYNKVSIYHIYVTEIPYYKYNSTLFHLSYFSLLSSLSCFFFPSQSHNQPIPSTLSLLPHPFSLMASQASLLLQKQLKGVFSCALPHPIPLLLPFSIACFISLRGFSAAF